MGRIVKSHGRIIGAEVFDETARNERKGKEAAALLKQAEARLQEVEALVQKEVAEARAEGMAQGRAEGMAQAQAEVAARAVALYAQIEADRRAVAQSALSLARAMAEKILGHAAALDDALVARTVAGALKQARITQGMVAVRCHPDDLENLSGHHAALVAAADNLRLTFQADAAIGRGGCLLITPSGQVDGRLAYQLDALQEAIAKSQKQTP